jgi:HSP20 family protein
MRRIPPQTVAGVTDAASEIRRLIEEISRTFGSSDQAECVPAIDVFETAEALRVVIDLPGVAAASIQVVLHSGILIVAGLKMQPRPARTATFHLLERTFGRFGRGVPVGRAFDGGRATARLVHGELTVTLPKIPERRGRRIPIAVVTE